MFISHVVSLYPEQAKEFPGVLMDLLGNGAETLPGSLRRGLVQCLLLVRKKKLIDLDKVLTLFFRLFRVIDKQLRDLLYDSIIGEIKRANTPHRNNALNKSLQNFMFSQLHQQSLSNAGNWAKNDSAEAIASHKALQVMIELYRRNIWNDAKTVNVVAEACTSHISYKVTVTALNFFLGRCKKKSALSLADESDSEEEEEESEDEGKKNMPSMKEVMFKMQISGSTKAKKTKLKRFKAQVKRQEAEKRGEKDNKSGASVFSAIHLLNDPYGFVEKLFSILKKSTDSFEFKLLMINVISRVIGAHKLIFLDLYSFLLRYVQPHQKNVTQVLAYAAQASHELVPPDVIAPVVKAIANNFISDHCRNEVIAAGLNGLTQICTRCPLAMDSTLLQDLTQYKGYNDKSVMVASRSLISLYREKNPELLHRKDRGKEASMAMQRGEFAGPKAYGHTDVALDIEGADLLNEPEADEAEDGWVECSEDSEDSGSEGDFEDVPSGDEDDQEDREDEDSEESEGSEEEDSGDSASSEEIPEGRQQVNKIMSLATQKIFTPQDFALLKRKRLQAAVEAANGSVKHHPKNKKARTTEDLDDDDMNSDSEAEGPSEVVRPRSIEVLAKKPKADYAARMDSIKAGRQGRMEFGSKRGKDARGSITNAEKSKRKNQIMMAHKYQVKQKKQRSFREVQKVQTAHAVRRKTKKM